MGEELAFFKCSWSVEDDTISARVLEIKTLLLMRHHMACGVQHFSMDP